MRKFRLSRRKLERLGSNYASIGKIEVIEDAIHEEKKSSDASDAYDTRTEKKTISEASRDIENRENYKVRQEYARETAENIENIARQTPTKESVSSPNVSEVSQASLDSKDFGTDPFEGRIASDIMPDEPILPAYVYRLAPHSDLFGCKYCKVKGDKWSWEKHFHKEEEVTG